MIYKGLNRTGEIETVKAHGGSDVAEVYGGINESNPIYYKTRTLTGTSPLSYKALSKPLSDYLISGNTLQNGVPSPDNPVDVVGVGERTANLFDINSPVKTFNCSVDVNDNALTQTNSGIYARSVWKVDNLVIGAKYTVHITANNPNSCSFRLNVMDSADSNAVTTSNTYNDSRRISILFTATETTHIIRIYSNTLSTSSTSIITFTDIMVNAGSIPLPYEPYGYKLPLTVNGTEYPIYLGQVPTTRRIKKVVFDGTEQGWGKNTGLTNSNAFSISIPNWVGNRKFGYCTHYQNVTDAQATEGIFFGNSLNILTAFADGLDDATKFKQYLAAQFAAGTPVTIWYVLAEPETGIVNEPLHKIGDYADTVSMAQASVTIPTIAGTNTLLVDTTVQPSEVSITGNIKEVSR